MIVACEKQDDKNTKNFEVLFEKAKKEIKKESIKKIHIQYRVVIQLQN